MNALHIQTLPPTRESEEAGPRDINAAYEAWIKPHLPDLAKYCRYLAGSGWDAEDLLQDTLLKSYVYFGQANPAGDMKPYIFRMARNLWIDVCRKRQRRRTAETELPDAVWTDLDYAEIRGSLEWLAERLPRRSIEMLLLFDYFGYSMREVADATGTSVSSVKSLLFRTRSVLRGRRELRAGRKPSYPEVERWSVAVMRDRPRCLFASQPEIAVDKP
ncbi:RNA polymerase sigma factor [Cohnella hongkongensis]|uniref:RNA polymerase sigma factor n=1 Tax=Cohnella hongkongensis TaxID=178337 RepID=A0ABV9F9M8_9BACL